MSGFSTIYGASGPERKFSKADLIRGLRMSIADEYEAIQLYTQLAEATDDPVAKAVLLAVTIEEKRHAGEFLQVVRDLEPNEEQHYGEGYHEVKEIKELLSKGKSPLEAAALQTAKEK